MLSPSSIVISEPAFATGAIFTIGVSIVLFTLSPTLVSPLPPPLQALNKSANDTVVVTSF